MSGANPESADDGSSGGSAPKPVPADDEGEERSLRSRLRAAVTVVLVLAFVVSLAGVIYVALTPQQATDPYTEFYVLGPGGEAADYPTNLTAGEQAEVIVGVTNHEQRSVTYTLLVRTDERQLESRTFTVGDGATEEQTVTYTLEEPGRTRVRFHLYRDPDPDTGAEPYRSLRLWTNVTAGRN